MTRKKFHIFSLVLAIAFCISCLSITAFARSAVYWTDNSGDHTAIVDTTPASWCTEQLTGNTSMFYYRSGDREKFVKTYHAVSRRLDPTFDGAVIYRDHVIQAMRKEGVMDSYTAWQDEDRPGDGITIPIPVGSRTGYYVVGITYECKNGTWNVAQGVVFSENGKSIDTKAVPGTGSGNFRNAPTGDWYLSAMYIGETI